ncbi:transcription elongation factor spt5 [Tritrichomonas musculus]|uniref:Transcription elongation factor spt5 n=1 Tax=Tritrichomonas musculus TaxID=1915356 RepID=A0ABR2IKK0_9EUKA
MSLIEVSSKYSTPNFNQILPQTSNSFYKRNQIDLKPGKYVRIHNPQYNDDFAQVVDTNINTKKVLLKLIPRINYRDLLSFNLKKQSALIQIIEPDEIIPLNFFEPNAFPSEYKKDKVKISWVKNGYVEAINWDGEKYIGKFLYKHFFFSEVSLNVSNITKKIIHLFESNMTDFEKENDEFVKNTKSFELKENEYIESEPPSDDYDALSSDSDSTIWDNKINENNSPLIDHSMANNYGFNYMNRIKQNMALNGMAVNQPIQNTMNQSGLNQMSLFHFKIGQNQNTKSLPNMNLIQGNQKPPMYQNPINAQAQFMNQTNMNMMNRSQLNPNTPHQFMNQTNQVNPQNQVKANMPFMNSNNFNPQAQFMNKVNKSNMNQMSKMNPSNTQAQFMNKVNTGSMNQMSKMNPSNTQAQFMNKINTGSMNQMSKMNANNTQAQFMNKINTGSMNQMSKMNANNTQAQFMNKMNANNMSAQLMNKMNQGKMNQMSQNVANMNLMNRMNPSASMSIQFMNAMNRMNQSQNQPKPNMLPMNNINSNKPSQSMTKLGQMNPIQLKPNMPTNANAQFMAKLSQMKANAQLVNQNTTGQPPPQAAQASSARPASSSQAKKQVDIDKFFASNPATTKGKEIQSKPIENSEKLPEAIMHAKPPSNDESRERFQAAFKLHETKEELKLKQQQQQQQQQQNKESGAKLIFNVDHLYSSLSGPHFAGSNVVNHSNLKGPKILSKNQNSNSSETQTIRGPKVIPKEPAETSKTVKGPKIQLRRPRELGQNIQSMKNLPVGKKTHDDLSDHYHLYNIENNDNIDSEPPSEAEEDDRTNYLDNVASNHLIV